MEGADKERNRLFLIIHTHVHNTRPFSKTHHLMLTMEGADKERNRLLLVKDTQHKTIQENSHPVVGNGGSRQGERYWLLLVKHTHIHNTRIFCKTHILMLAMERADMERNRLLLVKHMHIHKTRSFSKTH